MREYVFDAGNETGVTDMTIYYLMAGNAFYQIEARTAKRAKQIYRELFGLRKMPSGSVISSDRECGFFGNQPNFETLN